MFYIFKCCIGAHVCIVGINMTLCKYAWWDNKEFVSDQSKKASTATFLFRTYERPVIPQAPLQDNIDHLHLAITSKLKSKSRGPSTLFFHHDCYRSLFQGKGRASRDCKSTMLEKQDFDWCNFHNMWDQCFDKNGDGVRISCKSALEFIMVTKSFCHWIWYSCKPSKDAPWKTHH